MAIVPILPLSKRQAAAKMGMDGYTFLLSTVVDMKSGS